MSTLTQLVPKGRLLYFNEEVHKYKDDLDQPYTSTTTVVGKYTEDFKTKEIAKACERIGRNPNHPKYLMYRGKFAKQLIAEWKAETERACAKGTIKHNTLEDAVKSSNNYKKNANGFVNDRIYTIDDIIKKHKYGKLTLKYFSKTGIDKKYPTIYGIIKDLVGKGFKIYAEIGVYHTGFLISGLIDILLVNDAGEFYILDWKTNKAPLHFDCGYYEKNLDGTLNLDRWIAKDNYFEYPLNKLVDSVGNHYAMQLSTYAYLVESFGLKLLGLILCHIRTLEKTYDDNGNEVEEVKFYKIPYLRQDVESMLSDHARSIQSTKTLFS